MRSLVSTYPTGRVLCGTLTLGQLTRGGSGAAPHNTPFSFVPLPAAPKKDDASKAAGGSGSSSKPPKTPEQRVCLWGDCWQAVLALQLGCLECFVMLEPCLTDAVPKAAGHLFTPWLCAPSHLLLPLPPAVFLYSPDRHPQLSEALRDAKLGLLKDLKTDSAEDSALAAQLVAELKADSPGYLPLLLEVMRRSAWWCGCVGVCRVGAAVAWLGDGN